jgi:hypothetical protein
MGDPLIIFKAISSGPQIEALILRVIAEKALLTLKDKNEKSYPIECLSFENGKDLLVKFQDDHWAKTVSFETFMVNFSLGSEKYLFQTRISAKEDVWVLKVHHLFHMQKRKNFRYTLPKDYTADLHLTTLNHQPCTQVCKVVDLSTEGCAAELCIADLSLSVTNNFTGHLIFGTEKIPVQGIIKNIREKDFTHLILGVEFSELSSVSQEKIITSITRLQRDIYFRKAG